MYLDPIHPCPRRPSPKRSLELRQPSRFSGRRDLHAAVGQVPGASPEAQLAREPRREPPEANSLHPPGDEEPARGHVARRIRRRFQAMYTTTTTTAARRIQRSACAV